MRDSNRSPRRRGKILLITLAMLIILGTPAAVLISKWANSPSEQTIDLSDNSAPATVTADQPLDTAYFKTVTPANWRARKTTDQANPNRLHIVVLAPSGSSGQVAITSDLLPSDQLAGVADYHLRASDPARYAGFSDSSFPTGSVGFKNTTGAPAYTVFMTRGSRFASITVSEESSNEQSLTLLKSIITRWQWTP